jgi:ArsR family transcriptional regulator
MCEKNDKLTVMKKEKRQTFATEILFRALADRTRLRLINLLGNDEICVCFIVEALKSTQPKISRHLRYLRRAGVVSVRREGKWMHYRLVKPPDPAAAAIFETARRALAADPKLQVDWSRLVQLCCSSTVPHNLKNAPKPKKAMNLIASASMCP